MTEKKRESNKKWKLKHPDKVRADKKRYRLAHPERVKESRKRRYLANKEKELATNKRWLLAHQQERREYNIRWKLAHKEKYQEYMLNYRMANIEKEKERVAIWKSANPEKVRISERKRSAVKKQFGFVPLNTPAEGLVGHHIDKEHVIYIPKELHKSIWHSVLKNRNMDKINTKAFDFLNRVNATPLPTSQ